MPTAPAVACLPGLVERAEDHPGAGLGAEVGGLRWHTTAGAGPFGNLAHGHRTQEDGRLGALGSDLPDCLLPRIGEFELVIGELEFSNSWQEAIREVGTERAQAAVLLRPVSVGQIAEWARTGRRMPPKTTYFRPKPRTGMVFRTLDEPGYCLLYTSP